MEPGFDYRKYAILYVDDEEKSLKRFRRAFGEQFRILTATRAREGAAMLERHGDDIGLLMTEQRMPGEKGVWLLQKARQLRPRIIRVLATAYADMEAVIAAVNTGAIYHCVTKPWDPPQLESVLKRGLGLFIVQQERDALLRRKSSVLRNLMISDRLISLGLLAAGLGHHIRNSLVAVKTFLDLVPAKMAEENVNLDGLRDPGFWKEYYQSAQGQILKINTLLKDLWTASEKPPFNFTDRVQLDRVIAEALSLLEPALAARNLHVENQIPGSLPIMRADRPKICRLFDLLLKEEIASLPPGSRITLRAQLQSGRSDERRCIEVQLRDDGPGLPQEALRLVFDPFFVRSDSPTEYGIHLMACYFIVNHHGGRIEARSESGQGTTFTLQLPLNPEQFLGLENEEVSLDRARLNDSLWEKLICAG